MAERSATTRPTVSGARVGQLVGGRYRLVRLLGAGGMGEVYEGMHELVGKRVAVKCLWLEHARDLGTVERFEREARAASLIGSPHVVDVLDMGRLDDGAPYIVMELLEGRTLAAAMRADGPFRIGRTIRIAQQIAGALAAAHARDVVHRDLKPDNVFLSLDEPGNERVTVLDFGIARFRSRDPSRSELTRTGTTLGTPGYMSPEQALESREVDGRSDVWALGVILYRSLAAELPFAAESYPVTLLKLMTEDAPRVRLRRPDVPEALDAAIAKCLARDPVDRFATMLELSEVIAPFQSIESLPVLRKTSAPPAEKETLAERPESATPSPVRAARAIATTAPRGASERTPRPRTPSETRIAAQTTAPPPARAPSAAPVPRSVQDDPSKLLFRAPRESYPFDLGVLRQFVPAEATIKGIFLQSVLERSRDRKALFESAGVADRRVLPFSDYSWLEYMKLLVEVARENHPGVPTTLALRKFQRSYYEIFGKTLTGRVIFGALGKDASRILPLGPRGWQVSVKLGSVHGETLGDKHVRYHFENYPSMTVESCDVGVVEGALSFLGESKGRVEIAIVSPTHSILDITW